MANRGEIAVRLLRACKKVGITGIAIYAEEDSDAMHVGLADEAYPLTGRGASPYIDIAQIIKICSKHHVQAVLPGYGFLSENAGFAQALKDASIHFIGPESQTLVDFGLKHCARELAIAAGVPVVQGSGTIETYEEAESAAEALGFPVMVKASAGGGGMGLQVCHGMKELRKAVGTVRSRGSTLFNNTSMFLEKYVEFGRHIETQIFGNGQGDVLFFGERECSIQRRHQKVIEESPSPFVLQHPDLRQRLKEASLLLGASVNYKSAGTVEFLVDDTTGEYYFLEMNTRLQVEHGVTELCYEVDLVELMLLQADQELQGNGGLSKQQLQGFTRTSPVGHSLEARIYAENPAKDFAPSPGLLQHVSFPCSGNIRVDSWVESGSVVSPSFDPLLAKVMVHARDRNEAIAEMSRVLRETALQGPPTNIDFLLQVLECQYFVSGQTTTNLLSTRFQYDPVALEFLDPGTFTTVQDYPGRVGIPNGVPVSGPMDSISFRAANILVGNPMGTEGFEITLIGPKIKFYAPAVVAVCGASFSVTLDGESKACWSRIVVKAGSILEIGEPTKGARGYLAIRGGLPHVASYLHSKSTMPSLNWGGYQGRCMRTGDFLFLDPEASRTALQTQGYTLPRNLFPTFEPNPHIYVLPGPWFDGEFLDPKGQDMLMTKAEYKLSYNSSRTGIRLEGPAPMWARKDGGDGGSHPSNMVGFGCPTASVSFTGDSALIMPVDAPNQTGFIVTHTIARCDLARVAQLRPGDSLRFRATTWAQTRTLEARIDAFLDVVRDSVIHMTTDASRCTHGMNWGLEATTSDEVGNGIIASRPAQNGQPRMKIRQAGDSALLYVLGDGSFDLALRARIQQLVDAITANPPAGFGKFSVPDNISALIYYDPRQITQNDAVQTLLSLEQDLPSLSAAKQPCRMIHLPAVFDGAECKRSIERYMALQRSKASYLPDNIDFIRRSNGLTTREKVKEALFETPMLVNAVGWLMGLPVYIPIDPRFRLNVPKYNPSRTYTAAGSLGIGGNTCSIYPSDSPGGYMLWGATLPGCCWDTYGRKPGFSPEKPWLFESFDQIIFHEVPRSEFDEAVKRFKAGLYTIRVEAGEFDMAEYQALIKSTKDEVSQLRNIQKKCTAAELQRESELYDEWLAEKTLAEEESKRLKELRKQKTPANAVNGKSRACWSGKMYSSYLC